MARVVRTEIDRWQDLVFILNLKRTMGDKADGPTITRLLNEFRGGVARQTALEMGATAEEADAAAEAATLTVRAINYQIQQATKHAQKTARMTMGMLLDGQVADVQGDIEDSYRASESVWTDIERSRQITERVTRGRFPDDDEAARLDSAGKQALRLIGELGVADTDQGRQLIGLLGETMSAPKVRPYEMTTLIKETAAASGLYARLPAERASRQKLRAEIRSIYFGREMFEAQEARQAARMKSLTQAAADAETPDAARDVAMTALTDELESLTMAQDVGAAPWAPEMMAMQRGRSQDLLQRIRAVREIKTVTKDEDGQSRGFTMRVVELDPEAEDEVDSTLLVET